MRAKDLVKARMWCLDEESWSFDFQFNPSTLAIERASDVGEGRLTKAAFGGPPKWDTGARDTLSFEALVDTSMGGAVDLADATAFETAMLSAISATTGLPNEESVMPLVHDFYRFTLPVAPVPKREEPRPPVVAFVWERFEFMGFVTSFNADFTLFDHKGKAKRATLTIEMEGRSFSGGITRNIFLKGKYEPTPTNDGNGARGDQNGRFDLSDRP